MPSLLMISVLDVNEEKWIYYGAGTVFFLVVFFNIVTVLFVLLILVKLGEKTRLQWLPRPFRGCTESGS